MKCCTLISVVFSPEQEEGGIDLASARQHLARPCTDAVTTAARAMRHGFVRCNPPPPDFPALGSSPGATGPVRWAGYSPCPVSPDTGIAPRRNAGRLAVTQALWLTTSASLQASYPRLSAPRRSLPPLRPLRPQTGCQLPVGRPPCPGRSWTSSAKQKSRTAALAAGMSCPG